MNTSPDNKPLPDITSFSRPFWKGAFDGRLMVQQCEKCGTKDFLPKPWCIECGSRALSWTPISGSGEIYSYSVSSLVMMNLPGWKADLPVALALVDLDAGPRMYAQIVGVEQADLHIGMRVEAVFEPIGTDAGIVKFRPGPAPI